ncbi:MAG: DUF3048 domain-containing protein, partial [Anaerolineae bacterium]
LIVIALGLAACGQAGVAATPTPTPRPTATSIPVVGEGDVHPTEEPTPLPVQEAEALQPVGPETFPPNVNPLTGIAVPEEEVEERLDHRPILIKVSNNPPSFVLPHAGLQQSDHVWEHQVEGFALTRFTAVVYGDSPQRVGSVRSGRPPDLEMVPMYQSLYVSSGFSTNSGNAEEPWRMREYMLNAPWFERNFSAEFGYGVPYNIRTEARQAPHNLFAVPQAIWEEADNKGINERPDLTGLAFAPAPPQGGTPTAEFIIDYPGSGPRVTWRWDEERAAWLRWTTDDFGEDGEHIDDLTDEQLAFENVVVIFALHTNTDWPEDVATGAPAVAIDLFGTGEGYLLRNGQRYPITWERAGSESDDFIQLLGPDGTVIALMNGRTWFQLSSQGIDSPELFFDGERAE